MGSHKNGSVLIKKGNRNVESFVEFVQLLSNKTATTLKSIALLIDPVHAIKGYG